MKAEVLTNGGKINPPKFPVLMKAKDSPLIILFTAQTAGFSVFGTPNRELGEYSTDWIDCDDKYWEKFTGEIILKND